MFGYPKRDERVDFATGMWGIWMPGFMQFITGVYLFVGLTWLGSFKDPLLYMAALAFWPFIGLTCIYVSDFFASRPDVAERVSFLGEKALGAFHIGTGSGSCT